MQKNIAHYYTNRANVYGKLGQLDSALADVNTCISLDPDNARAYHTRYLIHRQQGRYDDAVKDVEKYLKIAPDDQEMQDQLRMMRMRPGR